MRQDSCIDFTCPIITFIYIQVHFVFHYVLSEIKQIYGKNGQLLNKQGRVIMDKWIH
jgi:hypothetical protein